MARHSWRARTWTCVPLLVTFLALSACGSGETAPEPEIPPTPTLIPTLPAPATIAPAAPTATTEPEATVAAAVTPEAAATDKEATAADTASSEVVTDTEETTSTEEVTATAEVTATEEGTGTEGITDTEGITGTEEAAAEAASEEITDTDTLTAGADAHAGHTMTGTEVMTRTEEVGPSPEITDTDDVSGSHDVSIFFLQPTTNAIVPVTFTVAISYTGVQVVADHDDSSDHESSDPENNEDAGHLHLLVDSPFVEPGQPVPSDETHIHLADGATATELSLTPGSHTLRLQFANSLHLALEGDQYRAEIVVSVVEGAPEQAVRIASPTAGATVPPTFTVVMAATGFDVEPAGIAREGAGHFHLLIDEPFVVAGEIIPTDETHLHFGQGQLSTEVTLEPGTYLIRLQLADGEHRALAGEAYRAEVEVIVDPEAAAEQVMFIKPADGATVTSPFLVAWAASGLIIEPAGAVLRPEAGHLHVLIDEDFVDAGEPIPDNETHLHFGKGQTSTELTLEPGEHTLRLQMANGAHVAQDGAHYQDEITVTVR